MPDEVYPPEGSEATGKAWHPCCLFFMMVECLFRLAYVFLVNKNHINQHVS